MINNDYINIIDNTYVRLLHTPNGYAYQLVQTYNSDGEFSADVTFSIESRYYDEDFMNLIVEICKKHSSVIHFSNFETLEFITKPVKVINNFIREHIDNNTDYTVEEFFTLLFKADKDYCNEDDNIIHTIIQNGLNDNKFSDFTDIIRPYYWDVLRTGVDSVKHALSFDVNKQTAIFINKINNILNDAKNTEYDNDLIDNYTIKNNRPPQMKVNHKSLHLDDKKFVNFLKTLTVGELKTIYRNIPVNVNTDDAIEIAKNVIERQEKLRELTLLEVTQAYYDFVVKTNQELDKNVYIDLNKNLVGSYDNTRSEAVYFVIDYINNMEVITKDDYTKLNKILLNNGRFIFIDALMMYNVKRLNDRIGIVKTVNFLYDFKTNEFNPTKEQWDNIVENYNDYKDMPVGFIRELV